MEQAYGIERCAMCHVPGTRDKVANRQMTAAESGAGRRKAGAQQEAAGGQQRQRRQLSWKQLLLLLQPESSQGAAANCNVCKFTHSCVPPPPGYKVSPDRRQTAENRGERTDDGNVGHI